tara:strand:- start:1849 stop:2688 length:840 start_codon:yes stop_codon:yes gene_type:complete
MEFYNQSLQLLVKGMRRRGLDFSITETNYTTTLICGKQSYKFVSKPMNKPTFLVSQMLYSAVKKSNILGKIKPQDSKYFQTYHHIKDIFDQEVLNIDIKNAYPTVLKNLGIADEKLLKRLSQLSKPNRLACLGMLAQQKTTYQYKGTKIVNSFTKEKETRPLFLYLVQKIDNLMQEIAMIAGEYFIFYWVDGIYLRSDIPDSILNEITKKIKQDNYRYHFDILTEFNIWQDGDKLLVLFKKDGKEKTFQLRDSQKEENWKNLLEHLVNQDYISSNVSEG